MWENVKQQFIDATDKDEDDIIGGLRKFIFITSLFQNPSNLFIALQAWQGLLSRKGIFAKMK